MSSPSAALYATLTAGVASTAAAGKVYPRAMPPQSATLPYVTYFRVSGMREPLVGRGTANHGRARYQANCYAATQLEAEAIADAIVAICRSAATSPIRAVDVENGPYDLPEATEGRESMTAVVAVDLGVTYKEH